MVEQYPNISNLSQHLLDTFDLDREELNRLLDDILNFFDSTIEEYIQIRHLDLKALGLKNEEIYRTLQQEIERTRFKAPTLSLRQIRRIIYG